MNVHAADYVPGNSGGGGGGGGGGNGNYHHQHQQRNNMRHQDNHGMHNAHQQHHNLGGYPPVHHQHHPNSFRQPQPHHHHQQQQPLQQQPLPQQPREAILVLDGVPPRRADTADRIAHWWKCPSIIDTSTPPIEDDESNPAAALERALDHFAHEPRIVIAGFLWNNSHEIHHIASVFKKKNIVLSAVLFTDTESADLTPEAFQVHDKPAHPLYCEVATLYFNEKNNFFLSIDDLTEKYKILRNDMMDFVTSSLPEPPKPWGNELRMTDYDKVVDLRQSIRALLHGELTQKFPTHFLTYPLFARSHEIISKKCLVTYDFEGDRGHLVRFNNKDYLMFTTGLVFTAPAPYRAPGTGTGGISFIFEVHSAKKKDSARKANEPTADFFVTDVVYCNSEMHDRTDYDERQKIVANFFNGEIDCIWKPVPTFEVSKFNPKEVEHEIAGYQFFENGGSHRIFLFKIMETSTANIRVWSGSQDEKTSMWNFSGAMAVEDSEAELANAVVLGSPGLVDSEKIHFGTVVRARMDKPPTKPSSATSKKVEKTVWRIIDRNWTCNYPTAISRTSSPWTVDGLFNALASLNAQ